MTRVFVDTSAWYAFMHAGEPDHEAVRSVLADPGTRAVTSTYVFAEVVTLTRRRRSHRDAVQAGSALLDAEGLSMERVTEADEEEAWRLFAERKDKDYSFTDCTSFVLMRRLGIKTAVALDPDFVQERFHVVP